ncbi:MAG: protein BatD [Bacteroidales bacterium]|nr:protein BatD [Bacteroidales bacterium]
MKKIFGLLLFIVCIAPIALRAQDDPKLTVSAKKQVVVGERFQVVFEANAEGKNFQAPSFDGFTIVGGPFTSSSSSFSMVNGSMSHTVKNSYTYALQAYKEGSFRIGAASLTVKGNKISSEPFEIQVLPDDGSHASASGGGTSGSGSQSQSQNTNDPQVSGKDLFLKVTPSKKSVHVGEQIVLTYKLYTKVPVSSLQVGKMPSYAGFWTKDISDNNGGSLRQSSEYINGVEYTVAEIQKVIVVPQRSGKLNIDPMSIECVAQIRTESNNRRSNDPFDIFFNDPFFNRNIVNVKKELSTGTLAIEVKNLPDSGKPASFAGAVGSYTFKSDIDKTELKTNEAFTLTLTVSGTGNIELLQMPEPNFPPDFEVYDPKITTAPSVTAQGLSGTKKAEYLVIPRRAGNFNLSPVEFSFFNPANGTYTSLRSDNYSVHVEKGSGDEGDGGVYASNQEGIKYLGSDVRHIMTGNPHLKAKHSSFFGTAPYFVVLLAMLLIFIIMLLVSKKREQSKEDTMANRNKKATKVARGRLKKADQYLKVKDQNNFYTEMSQALWGYIADKLGIERSKLSMDTVSETMKEKNVPDDLTQQFIDTLNSCEFARFAPGNAEEKMGDLYQKGIEVITKAEKVL